MLSPICAYFAIFAFWKMLTPRKFVDSLKKEILKFWYLNPSVKNCNCILSQLYEINNVSFTQDTTCSVSLNLYLINDSERMLQIIKCDCCHKTHESSCCHWVFRSQLKHLGYTRYMTTLARKSNNPVFSSAYQDSKHE